MTKALQRRVENLEQVNPANRGVFLCVETGEGESEAQAEQRCRREQNIPEDVEPDVTVAFIGLRS